MVPKKVAAPLYFDFFFGCHLGLHFYRFGSQLGPNLPPNLAPFWSQVGPKSPPKCYPSWVLFLIAFWIDFLLIFVIFLVQLGSPEPFKIELSPKRRANFQYFGKLLLDGSLGGMLSPTWHQLGAILRAKLAPSWLQVAPKTDPTTNQKIIKF